MDRKKLLTEILFHLDMAIQLMNEADTAEDDVIWNGVMAVHGAAETELNLILVQEMHQA